MLKYVYSKIVSVMTFSGLKMVDICKFYVDIYTNFEVVNLTNKQGSTLRSDFM